jgi:flagellin
MTLKINSGVGTWAAPGQLRRAQGELTTSMARLSSGVRIQSAGDDAAGLGISVRLGSEAQAARQLHRGVNDGIGLTQTAEAALGEVAAKLQRARELAVQAGNGTLKPADRAALAQAYAGVLQDIDQLARGTRIFGIHPLVGPVAGQTPHITELFPSSGSTRSAVPSGIRPMAYVPAGARDVVLEIDSFGMDDDIQLFTRSGRHLAGTPLGDATWTANGVASAADVQSKVLTPSAGFQAGAAYDATGLIDGSTGYTDPDSNPPASGLTGSHADMTIVYSGDGDHADGSPNDGSVGAGSTRERVLIDQVTQPLIITVVGSGVFDAKASWSAMPTRESLPQTGPTEVVVGAAVHGELQKVSVPQTPADLAALGLEGSALSSREDAVSALTALDAALETVSGHRATLASLGNRFEQVLSNLGSQQEQAQAAQSRIVDADYAAESAAMARARILADASRAMLAQANSTAEVALSLLRPN